MTTTDWITNLQIGDEVGTVQYGWYCIRRVCGRTSEKIMVRGDTGSILTFLSNGEQVFNADMESIMHLVPAVKAHAKVAMQSAYAALTGVEDDLAQHIAHIRETADLATIQAAATSIRALLDAARGVTGTAPDWIAKLQIGGEVGVVRYGWYCVGLVCGRTSKGKLLVEDPDMERIRAFLPTGVQDTDSNIKLIPAAEAHDKIAQAIAASIQAMAIVEAP